MTPQEAVARAWAKTDWGIGGPKTEWPRIGGYLEDSEQFIRHLNEMGFEISRRVPHEGSVR